MVRGEHRGICGRCGGSGCRSWSRGCSRRHGCGRIGNLAKKGVAGDGKVAPSTHTGPSAGPDGGTYLREQVTAVVGGVANVVGGKLRWIVRRLCRRNQRRGLWRGQVCGGKRRGSCRAGGGDALCRRCCRGLDKSLLTHTLIRQRSSVKNGTNRCRQVAIVCVVDAWVRRICRRPRRRSRWRKSRIERWP